MGSFSGVGLRQCLHLVLALVPVGFLAIVSLKSLNALLIGEAYAQTMGIRIMQSRITIIVAAGIATGVVTAYCGPVAFIGLAVPHVARALLRTHNHFLLLPASALAGSIVALLSDIIARVPGADLVLPVNAVTSLLCAPIVIYILVKRPSFSQYASS